MREGVGWPRRRKGQDSDSAACNPPTASLCSTQLLDCAVHTLKNYCTLHSLDAVDARLSLPSTDDPVVGGEEHVLGPPHRHPVHCQLVCAAVPDQPSVTGMFFIFFGGVAGFLCFLNFCSSQGFLTCLILLSAQQQSPVTEKLMRSWWCKKKIRKTDLATGY